MIVCFGSNYFGQLGCGGASRRDAHTPITFGESEDGKLDSESVIDVSCGSHFTVVLEKKGTLQWCGTLNGIVRPFLVPVEISYALKCTQVSCGRQHILSLMEGGFVLSWGVNYFGQLGHGNDNSWDTPKLIQGLKPSDIGSKVVSVVCGGSHSGAITDRGRVFMWGLNRNGQCGLGSKSVSILEPRPIDSSTLGVVSPRSLVCGRCHSAVLNSEGRVYAWGATGFGRLGIQEVPKNQLFPAEVPFFRSTPIHSLASGDFHMLALGHDCSVYSWGYGADGQSGQGSFHHLKTPHRIEALSTVQIVQISCGSFWSVAISNAGCLYAWGYGDDGWLGIPRPASLPFFDNDGGTVLGSIDAVQVESFDSSLNVLVPMRVRALSNLFVERARCGAGHTIVFASPRSDSDSFSEDAEVVMKTGSQRTTIDDEEHRAVQLVSWCRHNKCLELAEALSSGVNVNFVDSVGNTPLLVACQNGHVNVVKLLLNHGADINCSNLKGNGVLHFCFAYGFADLAIFLISQGADEFKLNNDGMTCYEGLSSSDLERF